MKLVGRHKQPLGENFKTITIVICCIAWIDLMHELKLLWRRAAADTAAAKVAWFVAFLIYCFQYFPFPESVVWFAKDRSTSIESRRDRGLYDIVNNKHANYLIKAVVAPFNISFHFMDRYSGLQQWQSSVKNSIENTAGLLDTYNLFDHECVVCIRFLQEPFWAQY